VVEPFKQSKHDPTPARTEALMAIRRRIEATIGQLVDRLDCRRMKVRDIWHLEHRLVRKILAHTLLLLR
jgi:hypothetical protein